MEIDLDVEIKGTGIDSLEEYLILKTQNLLKFGTKKVLWVLTNSKKVDVAEGESWLIEDWNKNLELIEGIEFNIGQYLAEEGVRLEA